MRAARIIAIAFLQTLLLVVHAKASDVSDFYNFDASEAVGQRGEIVRVKELQTTYPHGKGYRVLYRTVDVDQQPTVASGLIFLPLVARSTDVVVFSHRTTGIRPDCAPSLLPGSNGEFIDIPGIDSFLQDGDILVAPDLIGLGARPRDKSQETFHPYLNAASAVDAIIDAIRAARRLPLFQGNNTIVVGKGVGLFGHSQGGFASLAAAAAVLEDNTFELKVIAVSGAPARLDRLIPLQRSVDGEILTAYLAFSYAKLDADLKLNNLVTDKFVPLIPTLVEKCIGNEDQKREQRAYLAKEGFPATLGADTDGRHLAAPAIDEKWGKALEANTPRLLKLSTTNDSISILVTQGGVDPLVLPRATRDDVFKPLCNFSKDEAVLVYYPLAGHDSHFDIAQKIAVEFVRQALKGMPQFYQHRISADMSIFSPISGAAEASLVLKC